MSRRVRFLAVASSVVVVGVLGTVGVELSSAQAESVPQPASSSGGLDPGVAPGGNFDLTTWSLQMPIGSPGAPDTVSSSRLAGEQGFTNPAYFWTDKNDGSMTFWTPEIGVHTPNSKYARTELREMNGDGSAASWPLTGTHTLSAELRVVSVTQNVCVGQVHLVEDGRSTKPLLELFYHADGEIYLGIENSPAGGQTRHRVANVPLGTHWTYRIKVTGNTVALTVNGATTSYAIPSSFDSYHQYFKAGSYNQSTLTTPNSGTKVKFYDLRVTHS